MRSAQPSRTPGSRSGASSRPERERRDEDGTRRVRAAGDLACLVELGDLGAVLRVAEAFRALALPGVVDTVPAALTVLVRCADRESARGAARALNALAAAEPSGAARDAADDAPIAGSAAAAGGRRTVDIDVVYAGDDLAEVAALTGLGVDGVIAAHTGTSWQAAFGGFAPGFVYLAGGDPRLSVPRLDAPRTRVPAGAVALAGGFSAVYPAPSPGGWRLIGTTAERMWDAQRNPAARVAPGDEVRFRAVREALAVAGPATAMRAPGAATAAIAPTVPSASSAPTAPAATVLDPGMLALVQDLGRPGRADIGVTVSGALDRGALIRANAAVGNPSGAAALELLGGGFALRAEQPIVVAVDGAPGAVGVVRRRASAPGEAPGSVEAAAVGPGRPIALAAGDVLRLGPLANGLRRVLAFGGGLAGETVLGSRARDTLAGLGPAPLRAGDALRLDAGSGSAPAGSDSAAGPDAAAGPGAGDPEAATAPDAGGPEAATGPREAASPDPGVRAGALVLRYVPGPRDDWFAVASRRAFARTAWRVTPRADRVGIRLAGPALARTAAAAGAELASEGMVAGSVQVPPDGRPVLFLADHPVTGGYPVIGTVLDADLDLAAQLRPGDAVRFTPVDPDAPGAPGPPEPVRFALEVDGRRVSVAVPWALAAAVDAALRAGDGAAVRAVLARILGAAGIPGEPAGPAGAADARRSAPPDG
ncbi:urea amidolyase family protein [Leucobacter allii]|uniref:5-oxoprolinase subunit B/C family protein n=1 Tax=Leucobacter allii TaxID=2932247 RepID=UPI001FD15B86|nr:urea amidolyase family protein [Leucobacter allii]UOR02846.1 urea amidolyase family protein [Leucobacter allii]